MFMIKHSRYDYMIHGQFKFKFDNGFSILELLQVLQIYI